MVASVRWAVCLCAVCIFRDRTINRPLPEKLSGVQMCFVLLLIQAVLLWGTTVIMGGHTGLLAQHTHTCTHINVTIPKSTQYDLLHTLTFKEKSLCIYNHSFTVTHTHTHTHIHCCNTVHTHHCHKLLKHTCAHIWSECTKMRKCACLCNLSTNSKIYTITHATSHTHTPPLGRKNKLLKIWHLSFD